MAMGGAVCVGCECAQVRVNVAAAKGRAVAERSRAKWCIRYWGWGGVWSVCGGLVEMVWYCIVGRRGKAFHSQQILTKLKIDSHTQERREGTGARLAVQPVDEQNYPQIAATAMATPSPLWDYTIDKVRARCGADATRRNAHSRVVVLLTAPYPFCCIHCPQVYLDAQHNLDAGDKISFVCAASAFAPNVTAVDTSAAKWLLSWTADSGFNGCTKVVTGPGGLVGLIVAIVQAGILIMFGPTVMFYGPSFPRFTYLVKAIVVSSYLLLINSIISVNAFTAFIVFERFVTFFISTLTVTFTSVNNPGAGATAAGFALGSLIAGPLVDFLGGILYKQVVGCSGFGGKQEYFPNGEPLGCDLHSASFQGIFHGLSLLKWIIITISAYYGKKVVNFSTAVVGSSMLVKGIIDLTKAVGFQLMPEYAEQLLLIVTPIHTWVTYGVAIGGFFIQKAVLTTEDIPVPEGSTPDTKPKKKNVIKPQGALTRILFGITILISTKIDGFLERNLETIKDGGKAAMKRAMTKRLSSKKVMPNPAKTPDEETPVKPMDDTDADDKDDKDKKTDKKTDKKDEEA